GGTAQRISSPPWSKAAKIRTFPPVASAASIFPSFSAFHSHSLPVHSACPSGRSVWTKTVKWTAGPDAADAAGTASSASARTSLRSRTDVVDVRGGERAQVRDPDDVVATVGVGDVEGGPARNGLRGGHGR